MYTRYFYLPTMGPERHSDITENCHAYEHATMLHALLKIHHFNPASLKAQYQISCKFI